MCRSEERRLSLQSLRTAVHLYNQMSMINLLFGSLSLKRDKVKAEELEPLSTHGSAHRRPRRALPAAEPTGLSDLANLTLEGAS